MRQSWMSLKAASWLVLWRPRSESCRRFGCRPCACVAAMSAAMSAAILVWHFARFMPQQIAEEWWIDDSDFGARRKIDHGCVCAAATAAVCAQRRLSSKTRSGLPPEQRLWPRSPQRAMRRSWLRPNLRVERRAAQIGGRRVVAQVGWLASEGSWPRCPRWASHREVQGLGWKAQKRPRKPFENV